MSGKGMTRTAIMREEDAAMLYPGTVMHARMRPFGHRFTYSVFNLMIDIDRLDEATRQSVFFAVDRFGPVSFHQKDHGGETGNGLATFIRQEVAKAGVEGAIDRIRLLCYPRVFGYVFNPISVYYCEQNNALVAMVYEVRNTFGGKHLYVEPVKAEQRTAAGFRQECMKEMHVSPFLDMRMRYFFRFTLPGDDLTFRILEKDKDGPILAATFSAVRRKLSTRTLLTQLVRIPLLTLKVVTAIHFEALKLWLKGARFHPNPHKKSQASQALQTDET